MNRRFVHETRVGALILMASVIFVVAIFSIGRHQKIFGQKVHYKILFSNISGLNKGDAVMLNGLTVGNVDRIQFPKDMSRQGIEVIISVQKNIENLIREDSKASIASLSLIATRFVNVTIGTPSSPILPPGSYIRAVRASGLNAVLESSNKVIGNIDGLAINLQKILNNVSEGKGLLGNLLTQPNPEFQKTLVNIEKTTGQLQELVLNARHGKGALGYLLTDTVRVGQTVRNLQQASRRLNNLSKKLENSKTLMGRMLNDPKYGKEITQNLAAILRSLKNITAKIDTGKGTLGALVNDPEVYWGMRDAIYGVESNRFLRWFLPKTRKKGEAVRKEMQKRHQRTP